MSLPNTLTIDVDGQEKQLFMSYGLLNRLLGLFKTEDQALTAVFNQELRNQVLCEVLKIRGVYGVYDEVKVDELTLVKEEVTKIFQWVSEHFVDFFLQAGKGAKEIAERLQGMNEALQPSPSGSMA